MTGRLAGLWELGREPWVFEDLVEVSLESSVGKPASGGVVGKTGSGTKIGVTTGDSMTTSGMVEP